MSAVRMPAVLGRRACAALAACSAALHAVMLGQSGNLFAGAVLGAMIVGCLYCASHLWRRGTAAGWCTIGLMSLAMIALHTPMPAHHHGMAVPVHTSAMMSTATLLALVEVVVATAVLAVRTRNRPVISPSAG